MVVVVVVLVLVDRVGEVRRSATRTSARLAISFSTRRWMYCRCRGSTMLVRVGERISVHIAAGCSGALRRSCEVYFSNWHRTQSASQFTNEWNRVKMEGQIERGGRRGIRTRSTEVRVRRHLRKNFWKVWICGEEEKEAAVMTSGVE